MVLVVILVVIVVSPCAVAATYVRALRVRSPEPSETALRDSQNGQFTKSTPIAQVSADVPRPARCSR
jgi:hypothetical protein